VDEVIEMEWGETLEEAVKRAVDAIVKILKLPQPSEEAVQEGIETARTYAPKKLAKEEAAGNKAKKGKAFKPRYYALSPSTVLDLTALLNPICEKEGIDVWKHIKPRVTPKPHITITHMKNRETKAGDDGPGEAPVWDACERFVQNSTDTEGNDIEFDVELGHVVWNERIMALTVDSIIPVRSSLPEARQNKAQRFVDGLPQYAVDRLHVTVGTRDADVKPVEAKEVVEEWRNGKEGHAIKHLKLGDAQGGVLVRAVVKGLVQ
jgi:tRNA ligase